MSWDVSFGHISLSFRIIWEQDEFVLELLTYRYILKTVMRGDGSLIYGYDPEMKCADFFDTEYMNNHGHIP